MTTGRYIVEMEPAWFEQHIAQSAKINAVPLHITQAGILRVLSCSSIYYLHPAPACRKSLPLLCNVANPAPTLSINGTKLAVNPSMHRAVPKACCQLAETKPFVGLLNPTDGEVDSK